MPTFLDIAAPLATKFGFRMIPIPRGGEKRPVWLNWPEKASNTPEGLLALQQEADRDTRFSEWDAGCVADPNTHCVLDADKVDLLEQIERETGQKLPVTLKVLSGGRGCPHLYFLPTARSTQISNKSTGDFDFWVWGHHSVAPGSVHSSGRPYVIDTDVPLAPIPDWLCDWIEKQERVFSRATTGSADASGLSRLKAAYLKNLEVEDMFAPELSDLSVATGQHPTMLSLAGLLHDGERDADEIADILKRIWDTYFTGRGYAENPSGRDELERLADHAMKGTPCELTLPEGHPSLYSPFTHGLHIFGTQAELDEHLKTVLLAEYQEKRVFEEKEQAEDFEVQAIPYPLSVWDGTEYGEYGRLCTAENFTPPEFHIEALKTMVGAIAGNQMRISNEGAGRSPRFYTVLMADPGIGKNTAIDAFLPQLLSPRTPETGLVVTNPESLVWSAQHDTALSEFTHIGVCKTKTSSASGLSRFLPSEDTKVKRTPQQRLVFVYPELTEIFEKLGIEGSGGALMSALCDLYDGETFEVPALASQAPFGGSLLVSLLAGVQPRRWDQICGGRGIEGSGLDERFNLIPTTETRTKASLQDPDFSRFRPSFLERIQELDVLPYVVPAEKAAQRYMEEWFSDLQKMQPQEDVEDRVSRGRLNILAWRNALHYAWLTRKATIDVDAAERGARIASYQLQVRLRYRPLVGDGAVAKAANSIMRFVQKKAGATLKLRDIRNGVHGVRLGPVFTAALNHLVSIQMLSVETKENTNGSKTLLFTRRDD